MGGSLGLALAASGWHVVGWDPNAGVLATALARGAVAEAAPTRDAAVDAADHLVVLAGPPQAVIEDVATLETETLVMDLAGVKQPVIEANRLPRFVGTHPMAGREIRGPEAATGALFRGAAWVVVIDGADVGDIATVEEIIRSTGARPIQMEAAVHDAAVAAVSHLPQVLASALIASASRDTAAIELAAGSFRDLTRVAASDPATWTQLLEANRGAVVAAIRQFQGLLDSIAKQVEDGDREELSRFLRDARSVRRSLAPPVVQVRVALADRPGELAKVGHAFENTGVDVRDLQLRHAPHGGGGVLTVSVRPGESEALRAALVAEGLDLAE
jgi:prephenate dehydrogenase